MWGGRGTGVRSPGAGWRAVERRVVSVPVNSPACTSALRGNLPYSYEYVGKNVRGGVLVFRKQMFFSTTMIGVSIFVVGGEFWSNLT